MKTFLGSYDQKHPSVEGCEREIHLRKGPKTKSSAARRDVPAWPGGFSVADGPASQWGEGRGKTPQTTGQGGKKRLLR